MSVHSLARALVGCCGTRHCSGLKTDAPAPCHFSSCQVEAAASVRWHTEGSLAALAAVEHPAAEGPPAKAAEARAQTAPAPFGGRAQTAPAAGWPLLEPGSPFSRWPRSTTPLPLNSLNVISRGAAAPPSGGPATLLSPPRGMPAGWRVPILVRMAWCLVGRVAILRLMCRITVPLPTILNPFAPATHTCAAQRASVHFARQPVLANSGTWRALDDVGRARGQRLPEDPGIQRGGRLEIQLHVCGLLGGRNLRECTELSAHIIHAVSRKLTWAPAQRFSGHGGPTSSIEAFRILAIYNS